MITAQFPNASAIENHFETDKDFKTKGMIVDKNSSSYYVEHGIANRLANAFANKAFEPTSIKAKVEETMTTALGRPTYLEAHLIESISASLSRLAGVKPDNVDMRAA